VRLDVFLDSLAVSDRAPGSGSAAALTVSFAASLVAMVARCSEGWTEAAGIAAQALAIRDRSAHLARTDAEAWEEALTALARARAATPGVRGRDSELEHALDRAADAPLEIAELGADTAALAAVVCERCEGAYRADSAAAAALAAGAARAAAHLVEVNLTVHGDDERLARARRSGDTAADSARRVLESVG